MIILEINGDEYILRKNDQKLKAELFDLYKDSESVIIWKNGIIIDKLRLDELFTKPNINYENKN
jgi:hypothetical protein